MSKNPEDYAKDIAATLKNVAKDNAVRNGIHDEGFNVKITKNDIKKGTGRVRIKEAVTKSIVNKLNSAGFKASAEYGEVNIFVPPILGNKENFTLDEIREREQIIDEIGIREAYNLSDE